MTDLSALPRILREIAEASSLEAALRLATEQGGARIYVPRRPAEAHWLIRCMGDDGARALCALYGGEFIDLPVDPRAGQHARVRAIRRGLADGRSANEIARSVNVTRRNVLMHKARLRKRSAAPDLFAGLVDDEER